MPGFAGPSEIFSRNSYEIYNKILSGLNKKKKKKIEILSISKLSSSGVSIAYMENMSNWRGAV